MTDTAELIARLLNYAEHGFASDHKTDCIAAADALSSLVRERDELRARLFPYADDKQISGMSWDGFYLIGNDKSIKKLRQIENDAAQLSVYRAAFDERNKAAEARATAAEAERDELAAEIERLTPLAVAYDYLESPARADMAEAEVARLTAENEKMREAGGGTAVTEDGVVLTIQISGSTLAHAVKYMPKAEIFDEGLQDFFHPEIVDEVAFLKEMAGALRCEEEDGTTLVHRMIDDAAIHLMHVGGDGVLSAQEVRDRARASMSNTSEGGKDE